MIKKMRLYVFLMILNIGTLMCLVSSHGNLLVRLCIIIVIAFALGKIIKAAIKIYPAVKEEKNSMKILSRGWKRLNSKS